MSKKALTVTISVIAVTAIFVALHFYIEDKKKKSKIKEIEEDRLRLIFDSLNRNDDLSAEVKNQIEKLIQDYQSIDSDVSQELTEALQLLQIGQVENAIEDMVKIIGHLLENYYKENEEFIKWMKGLKKKPKRPGIHDLLTYCHKKDEKLNEIEYQFFIAIKTVRNKEDHQVNLKLDNYLNVSGIITAIGAIIKIQKIIEDNAKKVLRTIDQSDL